MRWWQLRRVASTSRCHRWPKKADPSRATYHASRTSYKTTPGRAVTFSRTRAITTTLPWRRLKKARSLAPQWAAALSRVADSSARRQCLTMSSTDSPFLTLKMSKLMISRTSFTPNSLATNLVWGSRRVPKAASTSTEASWPWSSHKLTCKISGKVVESLTWGRFRAVSPSLTVSRST